MPVDRADLADEAKRSADRIIEQLKRGAPFGAVAQQFSQGATAQAGGELGWILPGSLDPALDAAVEKLPVRQYSEPIRSSAGWHILYVIDRRQFAATRPDDMRLNLAQMTLPLPINASPEEVAKATADAQKATGRRAQLQRPACQARELKGATSGDLQGIRVGDLPANRQMFEEIPKLNVGGTAGPFRVAEGLQVVSLCGKVGRRRPADPRCHFPADPAAEARGGRPTLHARPAAPGDHRRQAAMTAAAPLAVTMGEPAGIGGELSLKAWSMRQRGARPFFVLDDAARLAALADKLGLEGSGARRSTRPADAGAGLRDGACPCCRCGCAAPVRAGHPDPANAPATLEAIERAARLALAGEIAGMVTNPIQKKTLQDAGFRHPGHTEYLAELAGGVEVAMMLACPELRVVPVTIHLSLAEAVRTLDAVKIVRAGRLAAAGLKSLFGIDRPRLAVAASQPACRRAGLDGRRGRPRDRAGDRGAEARRHRRARARRRPTRCSMPPPGRPTTRPSACITTRP